MKVINLISGPRNISTALMYAFAKCPDFVVLDEPFYGHYLKHADLKVKHPSHDAIVGAMECDEQLVVNRINELAMGNHVFVKGMAHHYLSDNPEYILDWSNVILIRQPEKLITSFAKVIPNPTLADIGIKKAAALVAFLRDSGQPPIVIESDELLLDPENYLRALCALLELSFTEKMLSWEPGGRPEDGIWAKHWYDNVHRSSGFEPGISKPSSVPVSLAPLLREAIPYYEKLQPYILKNT